MVKFLGGFLGVLGDFFLPFLKGFEKDVCVCVLLVSQIQGKKRKNQEETEEI